MSRQMATFQFLVVRLEEIRNINQVIHTKFQFLVVRLEGKLSDIRRTKTDISIPCGTIRSYDLLHCPQHQSISIPCGAIRSRRNRRQKKLIFSSMIFCFLRFLILKVVDVQKYEKPCTSTTNVFVCFSVCQRTYHDGNEQVFPQNTVLRQPPKENYRYYRVLYQ